MLEYTMALNFYKEHAQVFLSLFKIFKAKFKKKYNVVHE